MTQGHVFFPTNSIRMSVMQPNLSQCAISESRSLSHLSMMIRSIVVLVCALLVCDGALLHVAPKVICPFGSSWVAVIGEGERDILLCGQNGDIGRSTRQQQHSSGFWQGKLACWLSKPLLSFRESVSSRTIQLWHASRYSVWSVFAKQMCFHI
jgi:hypothetical protein